MKFSIGFATLLLLVSSTAGTASNAQNTDQLQKRLTDQYTLSKITADRSDLVTAGVVIVLQKDGLVMYSTDTGVPPLNIYRDGHLQISNGSVFRGLGGMMMHAPGSAPTSGIPQRKFVTGEKFWVTAITIQQEGVVFSVYSDPFNDVRYYGLLKFPFPKNSIPPADDLQRTIAEVLSIQPADNSGGGAQQGDAAPPAQAAAPPPPAAPPAPMPDIAPPPPPADAPPPTIALGQTKDQVTAAFGQPVKMAKLGTKEIYYYTDMKVTFTNGKVSNVE